MKESHKKLWEECKANHARLGACEGPHEFERIDRHDSVCKKCQGKLTNGDVDWYNQGLKHGRSEMEKRAVIEEGLTPPEDDKFPPAKGTKHADAIQSLDEHITKRLQEAAEDKPKPPPPRQ